MITTEPQQIIQFYEKKVVSFQVIDSMEGDTARGDYAKNIKGAVRPLLQWETDFSKAGF
jgi:lipopolysaccharide transport system ATP-binding protein